MATKTIPAQTIVICDACGKSWEGRTNRKREAKLTLKQHGLDYLGDPACDGTRSFDLCDICVAKFEAAINVTLDRIKKGPPHAEGEQRPETIPER